MKLRVREISLGGLSWFRVWGLGFRGISEFQGFRWSGLRVLGSAGIEGMLESGTLGFTGFRIESLLEVVWGLGFRVVNGVGLLLGLWATGESLAV